VLAQALGLLQNHFGDLGVALRGLIEGGTDNLGLDLALPIRDLFGPLIDQHDD
jgi:hypothetical protein